MQRKVQQIGSSGSFILTLPKDWCQTYDVQQGSELILSVDHLHPGSILVSVPGERRTAKNTTDTINYSMITEKAALGRLVLGSYLDGNEIIRVVDIPDSKNLKVRKEIKKIVTKLYVSRDTEIIDKSIEIHVSSEFISPLTVIGDLYLKAKNMVDDAFTAWIENDKDIAQNIIDRDEDADKLYFYIVRTLKKMLNDPILASEILKKENLSSFSLLDTLDLRMIASYLENLADSAEELARAILKEKRGEDTLSKQAKMDFQTLMNYMERGYKSYITKDQQKASDIVNDVRHFKETFTTDFPKSLSPMIQEVLECVVDIADLVGNY